MQACLGHVATQNNIPKDPLEREIKDSALASWTQNCLDPVSLVYTLRLCSIYAEKEETIDENGGEKSVCNSVTKKSPMLTFVLLENITKL